MLRQMGGRVIILQEPPAVHPLQQVGEDVSHFAFKISLKTLSQET